MAAVSGAQRRYGGAEQRWGGAARDGGGGGSSHSSPPWRRGPRFSHLGPPSAPFPPPAESGARGLRGAVSIGNARRPVAGPGAT